MSDFKVTKSGETFAHDIGCVCRTCVARRRDQAKDPQFASIVETQAAKLPPEQGEILMRAFGLGRKPWWHRLGLLIGADPR